MRRTARAGFFILGLVVLSGCSSMQDKPANKEPAGPEITGMIIRNDLPFPVTDVLILAPVSGNYAGCGNILPRSECSTSFQAVDYRRNPIVISWNEYGEPQKTDEFVVDVPESMKLDQSAWLEVIIFARGQAGARLVQ